MGERFNFIDYSKGVLIALVVFGHGIQYLLGDGYDYWSNYLYRAIYMFHMPLFMAISGYLSFVGLQKSFFRGYVLNKFKSYVIPIWVWSLVFWSVIVLISPRTSIYALPTLFFDGAINSLWFLWALFLSVSLTSFLVNSGRFFLYLYMLSLVAVTMLPDFGNIYLFKFVYPFFQIGYLAAKFNWIEVFRRKFNFFFGGVSGADDSLLHCMGA